MNRIKTMEDTAKSKAVERISNLIQRSDHLEKIDEFKKRETRKKATKEAQLKTALQSQLDGVKTGLELLKLAKDDLQLVNTDMLEMQSSLNEMPDLLKDLEDIREESLRHSQYEMAMENMSNIFNIRKNLDKAHSHILEGNLLHAHILLTELESSRDELLFELFRMGNNTEHKMLLDYFSDVEKLSDTLEKQLALNLKRTINTARKEPTVLVTTLRIIEREEKADALAAQRMPGFKSPGRPKKWRTKAFQILEDSVTERLEACQLENREENKKLWLIRYLEVMRQLILQDLILVKLLCVPCFPPSYSIVKKYIEMYHHCLSKLLNDCISNGLEGQEFASLLAWVLTTYTGPDLLGSPEIDLHPDALPKNLLDKKTINKLMKDYLKFIADKYRAWRMKILAKEVEEWWKNTPPPSDAEGHYHTDAPVDIFKMVNENLDVAKTVSPDLVQEMLQLSLEMIREYGQAYQNEVRDFKEKYFEDRKVDFTQFMIAILNNCLKCNELAHQTKDRYWKSAVGDTKLAQSFDAIMQTFDSLQSKAAGYLLEEAVLDLELHFQELVTRPWLKSMVAVDTIHVTLEDYFQDYYHLKPRNLIHVMTQGKELVAKKYLLSLLSRKLALKNQEERKECSEKINLEAGKLRSLFEKVGTAQGKTDCPFIAIEAIAEVIGVEDLDILSLELHSLVKRYPDITKEQVMAILSLRGDIGRFDLKAKASEIMPGNSTIQRTTMPVSIFSQVQIPPSIFN